MNKIKTEDFIELCKKFENLVKIKYDLEDKDSAYIYLSRTAEFNHFKNEINIVRALRNIYQHNNTKIKGTDAIEISPIVYESLDKIINMIENPPLVKDAYVKDVYYAMLFSSVQEVIKVMADRKISHVPILDENKKVVGVFSENTIFSRLTQEEIIGIDQQEKIKDYIKYIDLNSHNSEYFDYVGLNYELSEIKQKFNNSILNDKRLVLLFVTKTGHSNQKLEGIITPWDVM